MFAVLLAGSTLTVSAQKPTWVGNTPKERNDSYKFVEVISYGDGINQARIDGQKKLAENEQLIRKVQITVDRTSNKQIDQGFANGKLDEFVDHTVEIKTTINGKSFSLQAGIVDEYTTRERDMYKLHTLYMVAVKENPVFDKVHLSTSYGARGLWRSAIVPGWGQLYKKSKLKGGLILGGTALLAGGIIYTENMRAAYLSKKNSQPKYAKQYSTKAKNFEMARNCAIGATAALYVYNLVDAIVAPGARFVKISRSDRNGNVYSLAPTVNYDGSPLLSGSIQF